MPSIVVQTWRLADCKPANRSGAWPPLVLSWIANQRPTRLSSKSASGSTGLCPSRVASPDPHAGFVRARLLRLPQPRVSGFGPLRSIDRSIPLQQQPAEWVGLRSCHSRRTIRLGSAIMSPSHCAMGSANIDRSPLALSSSLGLAVGIRVEPSRRSARPRCHRVGARGSQRKRGEAGMRGCT